MKRKPKTADVVWPNAGVEAWYRGELQLIVKGISLEALDIVTGAYEAADLTIGFEFSYDAAPKNPASLLRAALEKWGGLWIRKLDRLSTTLAKKFADKSFSATQASMAATFKKAGFTVAFKPTTRSVTAFQAVVAENVNLIKSIPAQYLKDVQSQVWANVLKGSDLATLSSGLQKTYGIAHRRAAFIARDQNAKAKAVIENVRRQELGIKAAIWQHSSAGKEPRPTHVAMNGKKFLLADGMYDSDIGKNTWPGVEPNCRCSSRSILPGLEDDADYVAEFPEDDDE